MASSDRLRVEFVEDIHLPRFNIADGFQWEVRRHKVTPNGFSIAGGHVKPNQYKVIRK